MKKHKIQWWQTEETIKKIQIGEQVATKPKITKDPRAL